ncbi:hypothetical protein RB195_002278 [Necator americanus]
MWSYLYDKLRSGEPAANEPKGLRIWKMYIGEKKVNRTADGLATRFRRHMASRLHDAHLPCHRMMFLYSHLCIPMSSDVKIALQLKFGIEIELDTCGIVRNFRRVEKPSSSHIRESIDYTQQILDIKEGFRLQSRRERVVSNGGSDHEMGPNSSFAILLQNDSPQSRNVGSNLSPLFGAKQSSPCAYAALTVVDSCSVEVQDANHDAQEAASLDNSVAKPIVVSTSSDSCKRSLQHLCSVFDVPENADGDRDWRTSEELLSAVNQCQIREIVESYNLIPDCEGEIVEEVFREQKKLLEQSQNKSSCLRSLLKLMRHLKKDLADVSQRYRDETHSHSPDVLYAPDELFDCALLDSYDETIPRKVRREEISKIMDRIDRSLPNSQVREILREVEQLERYAANFAKVENEYKNAMGNTESGVSERISNINRYTYP